MRARWKRGREYEAIRVQKYLKCFRLLTNPPPPSFSPGSNQSWSCKAKRHKQKIKIPICFLPYYITLTNSKRVRSDKVILSSAAEFVRPLSQRRDEIDRRIQAHILGNEAKIVEQAVSGFWTDYIITLSAHERHQ